ncbi:MAG: tetratricopeptide repeat protein [Cytophagales bacterium]|nr:tetratricopeptide repeat protein [Rhizobacter sp.]
MHPSSAITRPLLYALLACGMVACAGKRTSNQPEPPTIKSLASRTVDVQADKGVVTGNEEKAIAAYRTFLEVAPNAPQRSEAMRRLGDLEMDTADNKLGSGEGSGVPDYKAAIARYQDYLKAFPNDPGNDRVYYQIARAYEQSGDLETALKTLDGLVQQYPKTSYLAEAQFRRGELLFTTQNYVKAEEAYATVLKGDPKGAYHDRALYMHGWSLFKQAKVEEALNSFFGVLDLKVANRGGGADLGSLEGLTRGDRELVEDTFRVTSLSLANLQGAESIPAYITTDARRSYEFRVYQQLGELYIKQERTKDAADAFGTFAKRAPLHAQAPQLQARVIDIYQGAGFSMLALDAKKDYVSRYGVESEFRKANPEGWQAAQPLVKTHMAELARHHHALAQKSKASADYQEAVKWYRAYLSAFPNDPEAAQNNFLLAELLYEDKRFSEAALEYERAAYEYPVHPKSADAGYSALLSYAALEKAAPPPAQLAALQRTGVESALRFGKAFPTDTRAATVLTNTAEKLFALRDERAAAVAQQVLALEPPAPTAQRRVAWTVVAHTSFESGAYDRAERAYVEVLALTPDKEAGRNELVERLAASVYKQGEKARAAGQLREAVGHFNRVAVVAPQSAVRATAQFDAAAALIGLKDWDGAARSLEDFRQRYPKHPLQAEVGGKLAVAYMEKGQWSLAAGEFERAASSSSDPKVARAALWQAAELHEKGGARALAAKTYERYLKQYPDPLETNLEARYRLAQIAKKDGNAAREATLMKEIFVADQNGGGARTNRTRYLGAMGALVMAEPTFEAYRKVALVEPLAKNLKLKKAKMDDVLKAYGVAANYGVADVTTAATFHIAALYQDFGKALMSSQRPKKLSKLELEQYNLMLEEQADPFAEKATEIHEVNAKRTTDGIYDQWVKRSFDALKELRPLRYGKSERAEVIVDAIR